MAGWRMAFRVGKNGFEMWPKCKELGIAAIEYTPVDDIDFSQYSPGEPRAAWAQLRGTRPASLRRFVYEMKAADVIYVKQGPKIVGKGVVDGPYEFDKDDRLREPNGRSWQHQRSVTWIRGFPDIEVQLGEQQIATVKPLTEQEVVGIEAAVRRLSTGTEGGEDSPAIGYSQCGAVDGDHRQTVLRQIYERRGQTKFRDALCRRYGNRCLVTGCEIVAILEAAHIDPYRGQDSHHPENGLLLRADIHTLFDLDLLGVEPNGLCVALHPGITREYEEIEGKALDCADLKPSSEPLRRRYEQFQKRLCQPL
jgi:hypothetical protein